MKETVEMRAAVEAFRVLPANGWEVELQPDKPIYTLVRIKDWPRAVHYEFRSNKQEGLFVELHIEDRQYEYLKEVLMRCRDAISAVCGRKIEYYAARSAPNRKTLPSLSIRLGHGVDGNDAAEIMAAFIAATRADIASQIGYWRARRRREA